MSHVLSLLGKHDQLVLILAILCAALFARVNSFERLQQQASFASVAGLPTLLNLDGYYYLGLARDLAEGRTRTSTRCAAAPRDRGRPHCSQWAPGRLTRSPASCSNVMPE